MKKIPYILFLAAAVLLSSCTKYLDIKPYGKTIPRSTEEFSALIHNHLESIDFGEEVILGNVSSVCDLECYADNLEANLTSYPKGNSLPVYVGDQINHKQNLYANRYEVIRDCNIIIENMPERESELARDVLGTTYAIRGVCYYNLLREYCEPCYNNYEGYGVPLILKFDMEEKAVRSSIGQVISSIESDFRKAIEYNVQDPVFRFNNDVVNGFLARLYFWVGDYEKALSSALSLLEKYPLLNAAEYSEMISSKYQKKGNTLIKGGILTESSHSFQYNGAMSTIAARPVSYRFVKLFAEKEKDVRYELSMTAKRVVAKNAAAMLRSAELQLIAAESYYHLGQTEAALAALNELRRMRIDAVVDYTMESLPVPDSSEYIKYDAKGSELTPLISAILNERRKEFFMEGDRWFELKRNGRPEMWVAKQGRKYTTMKFMYTFPLPITDVLLVEGLVQNPGYEKVK